MNTLESRSSFNTLSVNKRFKNEYTKEPYNRLIFLNNKSKNDESLKFTNFISNESEKLLQALNTLKNDLKYHSYKFYNEELSDYRNNDSDRIKSIINLYDSKKINSLNLVIKSKYRKRNNNSLEDKLRIYMILQDSNCEIILIDVYHLGLASALFDNKGHRINRGEDIIEATYNKYKNRSYCLSNIFTSEKDGV